jgi:sortase A
MGTYQPKHAIHRAKYSLWPFGLILIGIFVMQHSFFVVRDDVPDQVEPFIVEQNSAQVIAATPTRAPTVEPKDITEISALIKYQPYPAKGIFFGTITFQDLNQTWPMYQGTSPFQLDKGVGHHIESVLPGQLDNAVLAGHRETVFNSLEDLELGQIISVSTAAGAFDYKIREFKIVQRTDKTVIVPTKTPVLTLITCYPINYIGITNRSFIVSADLVAVRDPR